MPLRYLKVLLDVSLYFKKKNPCINHGEFRLGKNFMDIAPVVNIL